MSDNNNNKNSPKASAPQTDKVSLLPMSSEGADSQEGSGPVEDSLDSNYQDALNEMIVMMKRDPNALASAKVNWVPVIADLMKCLTDPAPPHGEYRTPTPAQDELIQLFLEHGRNALDEKNEQASKAWEVAKNLSYLSNDNRMCRYLVRNGKLPKDDNGKQTAHTIVEVTGVLNGREYHAVLQDRGPAKPKGPPRPPAEPLVNTRVDGPRRTGPSTRTSGPKRHFASRFQDLAGVPGPSNSGGTAGTSTSTSTAHAPTGGPRDPVEEAVSVQDGSSYDGDGSADGNDEELTRRKGKQPAVNKKRTPPADDDASEEGEARGRKRQKQQAVADETAATAEDNSGPATGHNNDKGEAPEPSDSDSGSVDILRPRESSLGDQNTRAAADAGSPDYNPREDDSDAAAGPSNSGAAAPRGTYEFPSGVDDSTTESEGDEEEQQQPMKTKRTASKRPRSDDHDDDEEEEEGEESGDPLGEEESGPSRASRRPHKRAKISEVAPALSSPSTSRRRQPAKKRGRPAAAATAAAAHPAPPPQRRGPAQMTTAQVQAMGKSRPELFEYPAGSGEIHTIKCPFPCQHGRGGWLLGALNQDLAEFHMLDKHKRDLGSLDNVIRAYGTKIVPGNKQQKDMSNAEFMTEALAVNIKVTKNAQTTRDNTADKTKKAGELERQRQQDALAPVPVPSDDDDEVDADSEGRGGDDDDDDDDFNFPVKRESASQ